LALLTLTLCAFFWMKENNASDALARAVAVNALVINTPSTNIRLLRPVEPFWSGRPMISGTIRCHAASLKTKRSITPKADR
jgi:hypothetical protein